MAGALPHVRVATGPNTFATSMHRQCLVTPGASPLAAGATLLRQRWRQQQRQRTRRLPGGACLLLLHLRTATAAPARVPTQAIAQHASVCLVTAWTQV